MGVYHSHSMLWPGIGYIFIFRLSCSSLKGHSFFFGIYRMNINHYRNNSFLLVFFFHVQETNNGLLKLKKCDSQTTELNT